jgi:hypothetical protein
MTARTAPSRFLGGPEQEEYFEGKT